MTHDPKPFELLLGELRGVLDPATFERVNTLLSSWSGQQLQVPSQRWWLRQAIDSTARRMLAQGVPAPLARDRLIGMGASRRSAYRALACAQAVQAHAVQARGGACEPLTGANQGHPTNRSQKALHGAKK